MNGSVEAAIDIILSLPAAAANTASSYQGPPSQNTDSTSHFHFYTCLQLVVDHGLLISRYSSR